MVAYLWLIIGTQLSVLTRLRKIGVPKVRQSSIRCPRLPAPFSERLYYPPKGSDFLLTHLRAGERRSYILLHQLFLGRGEEEACLIQLIFQMAEQSREVFARCDLATHIIKNIWHGHAVALRPDE